MHDSVRLDLPAPSHVISYGLARQGCGRKPHGEAQSVETATSAICRWLGRQLPALAMCSLNWADLFQHYLVRRIVDAMPVRLTGNRGFHQVPMPDADDSPAAWRRGTRSGLKTDDRLVIVALGGTASPPTWPRVPRLAGAGCVMARQSSDVHSIGATGWRSSISPSTVDALVTKPGLAVSSDGGAWRLQSCTCRPDWPEAPSRLAAAPWPRHRTGCGSARAGAFLDLPSTLGDARNRPRREPKCSAGRVAALLDWPEVSPPRKSDASSPTTVLTGSAHTGGAIGGPQM